MKKLIYVSLASALFAGALAAFPQNETAAFAEDEPETIKTMAHYEFNNEAKPGEDSSGNGFDLLLKDTSADGSAFQIKEDEDGSHYASFDRGENKKGACLYAPQLGTSGKDFSDLILNSYTVSITFRRDNAAWVGDHYMLSTGKYNSSFTVCPWKGAIDVQVHNFKYAPGESDEEKQQYIETQSLTAIKQDTSEWTTFTACGDAMTNTVYLYVNGALQETVEVEKLQFSTDWSAYTFCIGAQAEYTGNAATMFATADVKEVRVYDCALSGENVAKLYAGEEATKDPSEKTVSSLPELDVSSYDLFVTDTNTIDVVMNETLPQRVKVTLSNGEEIPTPLSWYPVSDTKLRGYVQSAYANVAQLAYEVDYAYTVRFTYDEALVRVSQVKLDGTAYTPGTPIDKNQHNVVFKVTPLSDFVTIDSVSYDDMEWEADEDDPSSYYVSVMKGANIVVEASAVKGTVTYYDGEEKLGTSKYSYNGSEETKTFDKEGYTFEGWYLDSGLTQKFNGFDYTDPVDISLYAKWTKTAGGEASDSGGEEKPQEKGCGSVAGISAGFVCLFVGAALIRKKER